MNKGFQCWVDLWGNITVADGVVIQPKTDTLIHVGSGGGFGEMLPDASGRALQPVPSARSGMFIGGSGRNLVVTGLAPLYSGAPCPCGLYVPAGPGDYRMGIFTLHVSSGSSATISDGTGTVAELTVSGAPLGDYDSAAYGTATYGELVGGIPTAFTLTVAAESASPAALPGCASSVTGGTGPAGSWTASDAVTYALAADTDFTIVIAGDGSAEMRHLTTVIAERAAGSLYDPGGEYEATEDGRDDYNSGAAWTAFVWLVGAHPLAGFTYLEIVESGGTVSAVNGPFFGSLPTASGSTYYLPLAQFDGSGGAEQFVTGAIIWP